MLQVAILHQHKQTKWGEIISVGAFLFSYSCIMCDKMNCNYIVFPLFGVNLCVFAKVFILN